MLTCDQYLMPRSLAEAFDAMQANAGQCRILAGATDTLPWAREGRAGDVHISVLIDLSRVAELSGFGRDGNRLRLGASTVFQRFLDDAELRRLAPALPRCAIWFADDQIRSLATIGGNLVNASPAADGIPPLLAANAVLRLASRQDGRIVYREAPLATFIAGPGRTQLREDEILVDLRCDILDGYGTAFEKVGERRSLVISAVCLCAAVKADASGARFADVRLALGGIGPIPQRLADVEAFLCGRDITAAAIRHAAEMPLDLVQSRTRRGYRREVVRGFMARALTDACFEAGVDMAQIARQLEPADA